MKEKKTDKHRKRIEETMADRKIQLVRIAHVFYKHKDIAAARAFYDDFGFFETSRVGNRTYYRGYGTEPFVLCAEEGDRDEFLGPAFVVESLDDLEHAANTLPDATPIYDLEDVPGGGKCVTFKDPVDGWPFHLVYGQENVVPSPPDFPNLRYNYVSWPSYTQTTLFFKSAMLFGRDREVIRSNHCGSP